MSARFDALGLHLLDEFDGDPGRPLRAECRRCGAPRSVSWQAIGSGSPPCLTVAGQLSTETPSQSRTASIARRGRGADEYTRNSR